MRHRCDGPQHPRPYPRCSHGSPGDTFLRLRLQFRAAPNLTNLQPDGERGAELLLCSADSWPNFLGKRLWRLLGDLCVVGMAGGSLVDQKTLINILTASQPKLAPGLS